MERQRNPGRRLSWSRIPDYAVRAIRAAVRRNAKIVRHNQRFFNEQIAVIVVVGVMHRSWGNSVPKD
jgi:hypothetical protein